MSEKTVLIWELWVEGESKRVSRLYIISLEVFYIAMWVLGVILRSILEAKKYSRVKCAKVRRKAI